MQQPIREKQGFDACAGTLTRLLDDDTSELDHAKREGMRTHGDQRRDLQEKPDGEKRGRENLYVIEKAIKNSRQDVTSGRVIGRRAA